MLKFLFFCERDKKININLLLIAFILELEQAYKNRSGLLCNFGAVATFGIAAHMVPRGTKSLFIWQKAYWIRMADPTFKKSHRAVSAILCSSLNVSTDPRGSLLAQLVCNFHWNEWGPSWNTVSRSLNESEHVEPSLAYWGSCQH